MSYLMIENKGVCPLESFTMLGISSSRNNADKIGQFGSGSKHGVNVLLRSNIGFQVFLGGKELQFSTKPVIVDDKAYREIYYKFGNERANKLSWVLDYGAIDWTGVDMALREFISNAIDASPSVKDVSLAVVDTPEGKRGHTRVFIEFVDKVGEYYNSLKDRFLHFTGVDVQNPIIEKQEQNNCKLYRKGVFVRELTKKSLFDYNMGDNSKIDESRNMDSYSAMGMVGELLAAMEIRHIEQLLRIGETSPQLLEFELDSWSFAYTIKQNKEYLQRWIQAYKNVFGGALLACMHHEMMIDHAKRKGHIVAIIPSIGIYNILADNGVPTVFSVDGVNNKGHEVFPPSVDTISTLDRVWNWLEKLHMTNGKEKPKCFNFQSLMSGDSTLGGYQLGDGVYISKDYEKSDKCMLEELAHYITGATDDSRDFQDFAFNLATQACKKITF